MNPRPPAEGVQAVEQLLQLGIGEVGCRIPAGSRHGDQVTIFRIGQAQFFFGDMDLGQSPAAVFQVVVHGFLKTPDGLLKISYIIP